MYEYELVFWYLHWLGVTSGQWCAF